VTQKRNVARPDAYVRIGHPWVRGSKIVMKHLHVIATEGSRSVGQLYEFARTLDFQCTLCIFRSRGISANG
jgi:hypothetical protein